MQGHNSQWNKDTNIKTQKQTHRCKYKSTKTQMQKFPQVWWTVTRTQCGQEIEFTNLQWSSQEPPIWRSHIPYMPYISSNRNKIFLHTFLVQLSGVNFVWDRIDTEWLNDTLFPWFKMFTDQGSCCWWRNQLHRGENSGSRFIFPHFQKNNAWFTNNGTLNSPTFKTNNIDLTNLSMKQHQTRQLFNETTLILPTFQWNNADLANQPLSILSLFLQTKRNC